MEEGQYSFSGYVRNIETDSRTWIPFGFVEVSYDMTTEEESEWRRYVFRSKKHARRFVESVRVGDCIEGGYDYGNAADDMLAEFRVKGVSASLRELDEKVQTLAGSRKLSMDELAGGKTPAPASVAELQQRIEELERLVNELVGINNLTSSYEIY